MKGLALVYIRTYHWEHEGCVSSSGLPTLPHRKTGDAQFLLCYACACGPVTKRESISGQIRYPTFYSKIGKLPGNRQSWQPCKFQGSSTIHIDICTAELLYLLQHFHGLEEAVFRNINACKELAVVTRSAYGPNGMAAYANVHCSSWLLSCTVEPLIRDTLTP